MSRKKIYNESKRQVTMTLTETAIRWLEQEKESIGANSLSDTIEHSAKQKGEKLLEKSRNFRQMSLLSLTLLNG